MENGLIRVLVGKRKMLKREIKFIVFSGLNYEEATAGPKAYSQCEKWHKDGSIENDEGRKNFFSIIIIWIYGKWVFHFSQWTISRFCGLDSHGSLLFCICFAILLSFVNYFRSELRSGISRFFFFIFARLLLFALDISILDRDTMFDRWWKCQNRGNGYALLLCCELHFCSARVQYTNKARSNK